MSDNQNPSTSTPSTPTPSSARAKLRKIPPIPIRRGRREETDTEDDNKDWIGTNDDSTILQASSLGLNYIRTRSVPLSSAFTSPSTAVTPQIPVKDVKKEDVVVESKSRFLTPSQKTTPEPGFYFLFFICLILREMSNGFDFELSNCMFVLMWSFECD